MLAGLFVSNGIKAEQGCLLSPTGFNTSFPLVCGPGTQRKEAMHPLGSTSNCTAPCKHRELAALQARNWFGSSGLLMTASSLCIHSFLNGHKLFIRAPENGGGPLELWNRRFAAQTAHTSTLCPCTRSQGGCQAPFREETEASFSFQLGTSTNVRYCSLGSHHQDWGCLLFCTAEANRAWLCST